mmetsp:Transcript_38852/g.38419  ORF Transcript_38852/g.38419 Transcript_38852/m.38419 type:complete len:82 (+) Transcript_38852:101-346(+)
MEKTSSIMDYNNISSKKTIGFYKTEHTSAKSEMNKRLSTIGRIERIKSQKVEAESSKKIKNLRASREDRFELPSQDPKSNT